MYVCGVMLISDFSAGLGAMHRSLILHILLPSLHHTVTKAIKAITNLKPLPLAQ
jgi:hypothetical protein